MKDITNTKEGCINLPVLLDHECGLILVKSESGSRLFADFDPDPTHVFK